MQVSIRAPVTRPGRLRSSRTRRASGRVSIRAPVTRPGRHYRKRLFSSCAVVSIRAPVTRPGRHVFQMMLAAIRAGFNPRPGHATGATKAEERQRDIEAVSIRAPVTRPGRHSPVRLLVSSN